MDSVVVVGASLAGLSSAHALRRAGFSGRLTLVGAEARRPYQRPPLSKGVLGGEVSVERCDLRVDDALCAVWRLGVAAVRLHSAPREIELEGGERIPFDGVVIATGARARRLRALDEVADVFTLRNMDDCIAIRERLDRGAQHVAIIGAGFIGCEVAATLRKRGVGVTLLDIDAVPMQRVLGRELGGVALALHLRHGVRMEMGVGVRNVLAVDGAKRLVLSDGRMVDADIVIVGVGAEPVSEWLEGSGVALDNGVVCDSACAVVGIDNAVAAGDVARWHNPLFGAMMRTEHWDNAIAQGEAAARTLLAAPGTAKAYSSVPLFWSDQYDVKLQMVGSPRADDEMHVIEGALDARRFVVAFVRGGRVVGAFAQNSANRIATYKTLIQKRLGLEALGLPVAGAS